MHRAGKFLRGRIGVGFFIPLMLCIVSTGTVRLQAGENLTLEEAVRIALEANPMIRATEAGKRQAGAGLAEAKSGRIPQLSFQQTFTNSNNPVFVFGSLLEQGQFGAEHFDPGFLNNPGSMSNFRSQLNLKVPVFNRFQVSSGIRQAELKEEQARLAEEWVKQQIRFGVIQAYYGVLVAQSRRDVAQEAVKTAESELESMKARAEQGMVVASDVLAMEVQLADFRQQLAQAEGDEQTALAVLNTIMARPIDEPHQLQGKLQDRAFAVRPKQSLITQAIRERPDHQHTRLEVEFARQKQKVSEGGWWPDLNLFANIGASTRSFQHGSSDFAVGAALSWNILDHGRDARIEQALAATDGAQAREDQKANEIKLEVVRAYQHFQTSRERMKVASAAVDQAAEALRIVQDRNQVGLTTVTEVLRAQTALLQARLNLLNAHYDRYLGYAGTRLATGSLTDVKEFTN